MSVYFKNIPQSTPHNHVLALAFGALSTIQKS